jgi:hypothetical protein
MNVCTIAPRQSRRLCRALVAAAAALAFAGAAAGPAAATTATATLKLYSGCVNSYDQHFDYTLVVQGTTNPLSWAATRVEIRLWGDDEWYDDLLRGPLYSYQDWSSLYYGICVNSSDLDEDWGHDEVYAGVRWYSTATGKQYASAETNRIGGYF